MKMSDQCKLLIICPVLFSILTSNEFSSHWCWFSPVGIIIRVFVSKPRVCYIVGILIDLNVCVCVCVCVCCGRLLLGQCTLYRDTSAVFSLYSAVVLSHVASCVENNSQSLVNS